MQRRVPGQSQWEGSRTSVLPETRDSRLESTRRQRPQGYGEPGLRKRKPGSYSVGKLLRTQATIRKLRSAEEGPRWDTSILKDSPFRVAAVSPRAAGPGSRRCERLALGAPGDVSGGGGWVLRSPGRRPRNSGRSKAMDLAAEISRLSVDKHTKIHALSHGPHACTHTPRGPHG